jgi:hypothetical protein
MDDEPNLNNRADNATKLWVALFGEHRSWRHSGYPPGPQDLPSLDALCEALRQSLQILRPHDRERLLGVIAAHPGLEVRRALNP